MRHAHDLANAHVLGPRFKSYQLEESRIKMVCPWGLAYLVGFITPLFKVNKA